MSSSDLVTVKKINHERNNYQFTIKSCFLNTHCKLIKLCGYCSRAGSIRSEVKVISDNSLYNINVFIPLLLVSGRTRRRRRGWDNPGRRLLSLDLAFYTTFNIIVSVTVLRQDKLAKLSWLELKSDWWFIASNWK